MAKSKALKAHVRVSHPAWKKKRALLSADVTALTKFIHARTKAVGEFALVFASDAEICELNTTFRGKNKPTNVLSFSSDEEGYLGDIMISMDTVEKEAIDQGKILENHINHLIVHGVLHLLGYDHENDKDAAKMEGLEIEILKEIGISNPYL